MPDDALDQAYGYDPAALQGLPQNFTNFVEDLKSHGYDPEFMGGYRPHGSVPGSLHPRHRALDIAQYSRNVVSPKFQAWINANPGLLEQLARRHGLRSGSTFHTLGPDTGHIDMPDDTTLVTPSVTTGGPASDPGDPGTPAAPAGGATNDEALMAILSRLGAGQGDALSRQAAPVYSSGGGGDMQIPSFGGDALAPGRGAGGGGGADMEMLLMMLMQLLGQGQGGSGSTYGGS